jgi:outer membrane murein-binding lipoprotein Lpp
MVRIAHPPENLPSLPSSSRPSRLRGLVSGYLRSRRPLALLAAALISSLAVGCGSPNKANIELRKQNQALTAQVQTLTLQHAADAATIAAAQQGHTIPTLPQDRLDQLFTVAGIQFGRLTGGARSNPDLAYDDQLQVFVVPIDQHGDSIKAAGAFEVQAFDLSAPGNPRLGTWNFPVEDAPKNFFGHALLYTYILTCPWQTPPTHPGLTIKVTFTDALTGRVFTAQRQATCTPPPVEQPPATQPAPIPQAAVAR